MMSSAKHYIRWFEEIGIGDVALVGGKNASLGELYRELAPRGIKVPNGFAVTAEAYWDLLQRDNLGQRIKKLLDGLETQDSANLRQRGNAIRGEITNASLPDDIQSEILAAYHELCVGSSELVDVAVRSSATAEDLPDASFAGQQETYLNVQGDAALLESCKRCFASLFTDRAISYRQDKGFDHHKVALSIGVQRMVWGHVFHRHRNRLSGHRIDQRCLWTRRECGPRFNQSRRVFCLQAHAQAGFSAYPAKTLREQRI